MDRRGFLKSVGKVLAGCAVFPSVTKKEPKLTKVNRIGDIKGKGMSQEEFDGLGLPPMKPIDEPQYAHVQEWGANIIYKLNEQKRT